MEDNKEIEKLEDHYIGDDVPLRFDAFVDGEPTTPLDADADIYGPDKRYIATGPAKCSKGAVLFVVDGDKIERTGIHTAIFNVRLRDMGEQHHIVKFKIVRMPIKKK